jgi:hypothetical protein
MIRLLRRIWFHNYFEAQPRTWVITRVRAILRRIP